VADAGCPTGTSIEVRNLFFNVPARRKFLRSEPTETAQIKACFLEQALSHPDIGMRLNADGRELYACLPESSREERIRELFGQELMRRMKPVMGGSDIVTLTGLISEPSCTRSDRSEQYTFVNGRAVHSPVIMAAANEVFRSTVPKGRHPSYFLYIQIPPARVDVNVHPAKREVRFQSPTAIRDLVISSLRSALGSEGADTPIQVAPLDAFTWRPPRAIENEPPATQPILYAAPPPPPIPHQPDVPGVVLSPTSAAATPTSAGAGVDWSHGCVLGQLQDGTVLLETRDGLVMLDLQAARERVIYERMMAGRLKGEAASQGLLVAASVSLAPHAAARVREHMDALRNMGFGIGEIGQDAFVVESVPACLGNVAADEIITQVAQTLEDGGIRAGKEALIEEHIARIASHASASRNATADPDTIMRLIDELVRTEMPYTCPHGRPTAILTSYAELARRFGRN
jgi:DNA mismatch repair protein MutL